MGRSYVWRIKRHWARSWLSSIWSTPVKLIWDTFQYYSPIQFLVFKLSSYMMFLHQTFVWCLVSLIQDHHNFLYLVDAPTTEECKSWSSSLCNFLQSRSLNCNRTAMWCVQDWSKNRSYVIILGVGPQTSVLCSYNIILFHTVHPGIYLRRNTVVSGKNKTDVDKIWAE